MLRWRSYTKQAATNSIGSRRYEQPRNSTNQRNQRNQRSQRSQRNQRNQRNQRSIVPWLAVAAVLLCCCIDIAHLSFIIVGQQAAPRSRDHDRESAPHDDNSTEHTGTGVQATNLKREGGAVTPQERGVSQGGKEESLIDPLLLFHHYQY
jgi:cytochrome c-type biogenesis protein CcmH/NrfG